MIKLYKYINSIKKKNCDTCPKLTAKYTCDRKMNNTNVKIE